MLQETRAATRLTPWLMMRCASGTSASTLNAHSARKPPVQKNDYARHACLWAALGCAALAATVLTGPTAWAAPAQEAYLKASNTGGPTNKFGLRRGEIFGCSVAVSGDTVVVGAAYEESNANGVNGNWSDKSAPGSGAAYVFLRSGTTWHQQAYLKASNTERFDYFGYKVAVSGNAVVVGVPYEDSDAIGINGNQGDNSATSSGAAYVFVRHGNWSQQAYLKASNAEAEDNFGHSVAVSGETVVVGGYGEDSNATGVNRKQSDNNAGDSGAAYVFVRNATHWSQQAYLKASNTGTDDNFGVGVAVSGNTVVVGAASESSNATGVNGNQSNNRS